MPADGYCARRDFRRRGFQPGAVGGAELGADDVAHAGVIGVEPGELLGRQQLGHDEAAIDGRQRQRLEAHHLALAAGHLLRLVTSTRFSMRMP